MRIKQRDNTRSFFGSYRIDKLRISKSYIKCFAVRRRAESFDVQALGSNTGYTVLEVISMMEQVTGKKIKRNICDKREGDGDIQVVDTLSEYCNLTKTLADMCLDQYKMEIEKND